jgi:hypothetical protein
VRTFVVQNHGANWVLLGAGGGLLLAGSLALRTAVGVTFYTPGLHEPPWRVAIFAAGWLLVGAGSRPGGSVTRGAAAAVLLYVLVGVLAWTAAPLGGVEALPSSVLWWPRDVIGRYL